MTTEPCFFYSHRYGDFQAFSQWYPCNFTSADGIVYCSTEQYMMAQKCILFIYNKGNDEILTQIMNSTSMTEIKQLGRLVKGFRTDIWDAHKEDIVYVGNMLKFTQNAELREILLSTGDRELVEAAANDRIWGIGFSAAQAVQVDRSSWGQNLLGKALEKVRSELVKSN